MDQAEQERLPPVLELNTFMGWAREAFEVAQAASPDLFPFETPFETHFHILGEDDKFTEKVNAAISEIAPRVQREGIKIPHGDIAVVSCVRKPSKDEDPNGMGIWTLDRVKEIGKDHRIVKSLYEWTRGSHDVLDEVKQWFVIARYQATPIIKPPIFMLLFGFVAMGDTGGMRGVCPISPEMAGLMRLRTPQEVQQAEYAFAYECSECLRQIAAIAYLESKS